MMRLSYWQTPNVILYWCFPTGVPLSVLVHLHSPWPPQHLTDIATLPRRPQWVSNYCIIDATMSKCALGKRNFAKTVIQIS